MLYDIHCHLDALSDIDAALTRARQAGVKRIVANGLNPENNRFVKDLAEKHAEVEAAYGIYPTEVEKLSDAEIDAELEWIREQHPLAIGEIGIDYKWGAEYADRQQETFRKCLALAQELDRPVIVHSRKAEQDVLDILDEFDVVADLHCFGGKLALAKRAAASKYYLSIPANSVNSTHFQRIIEEVPLKQLLLETDAPYLGPDKDVENEPANVARTAELIASIKGLDLDECKKQLWLNMKRFLA